MNKKVVAFLPCRSGSQRVIKKNTRPFAGNENGLLGIKLEHLMNVAGINQIVLSTDDEEVKRIGRSFRNDKIVIDDRPAHLATSSASTDDVVKYVPTIIKDAHVLWTHVTSPFADETIYTDAINDYFSGLEKGECDSLMSVTALHKFLWFKNKTVNYDRAVEKWPRTQTLEPVLEVNSAIFLAHTDVYLGLQDRIGNNPYLFKMDDSASFDIDWEIDFKIAELMWTHGS